MEQNQLLTPENFQFTSIQFKNSDVLSTITDQKERLKKLISAMKLGNNYKLKVRLYCINVNDQLVEIKAKVWSVTEKYVVLKNSIMIPISSIRDVSFT